MPDSNRPEKLSYFGGITAIILGLYLSSLYSYLLFHGLIEITTIAIGFTLFILTWNARRYLANDCLKLLGIGYAFIALIDLLHTLAYKGMNVFPGFGSNLPTQLWIAARFMQAATLCLAPLFVKRRINDQVLLGGYFTAVVAIAMLVFSGYFPDCYVEGKGLTIFKIASEYVVTVILLTSLLLFYKVRAGFGGGVYALIFFSILCTIVSEISFTAYLSVYGFFNMFGHMLKLAAFYLIYRALLVTGFKDPFNLIFRDLKQAEEALRKARDTLEKQVSERTAELRASEEKYRRIVETTSEGIWVLGPDLLTTFVTAHMAEMTGYSTEELIGRPFTDVMFEEDVPDHHRRMEARKQGISENYDRRIRRKDGKTVWTHLSATPVLDDERRFFGTLAMFTDITDRKRAEEKNFQLAAVVASSDDAIIGKTLEGIVTSWNNGAENIYGYTESEMVGRPISLLVPPEWEDEVPRLLEKLSRGEHVEHLETVRQKKDGQQIHMSLTLSPIRNTTGRIVGISTIGRNITERKRSERNLTLMNFALNNVHEAAFLIDENARFHYVNEESCRVLGYTRDELLGMRVADVDPDFSLERWPGHWNDLKSHRSLTFESRHTAKDGHIFPVEISANYIEFDGRGYNLALIRDITERKRVEYTLLESERKYRTLFEESFDGLFLTSPTGKILDMNKKGVRMFGYDSKEEMLSLDLEKDVYTNPQDRKRILSMINEQGTGEYEIVVKKKNGEKMVAHCSLTAAKDEGGVINAYRGIIRDITERKRVEEQLRKNQNELAHAWRVATVGEMASSLAHELNQPLCSILNFANAGTKLFRSGKIEPQEILSTFEAIATQAQRAGKIVRNVKDFTRKTELRRSTIDINQAVRNALQFLGPNLKRTGVLLELKLSDDLPCLLADQVQIEQVVLNLVQNALDAMSDTEIGHRKLGIETGIHEKEHIQVQVMDTGSGIAEEICPHLFESFFTTKPEGLGMGLTISRSIIENHQGKLWYYPNPDQGMTFVFTLPVKDKG